MTDLTASHEREAPPPALRRFDLDWVRIGAFALLIFYHVGMFYVPWDWHVKSPHIQDWLQIPMEFLNPWRLPLLFLVSGAATRFMSDKMSPGRLAQLRLSRLVLPLVFGILVVVPPQSYLQVVETFGYQDSFAHFYQLYLGGYNGFCKAGDCLLLPTYNHLWFVVYLLVYTLALIPVLVLAGPLVRACRAAGERLLAGPGLLIWPMLGAVIVRLALARRFPENHALVNDWYLHAISALPFLFGFLLAKSDAVWANFVRLRWWAAAIALVSYGLMIAARHEVTPAPTLVANVAFGMDQWAFIAAILGFARLHLAERDGPVRRYLTEAIFPFYIIHQTTIVVAAFYLSKVGLPLGVEAALLITATIGSCFLTYEVVRRVGWLRPLFGLKPAARSKQDRRAPLAQGVRLRTLCDDTV